jgi:hypothetical protein
VGNYRHPKFGKVVSHGSDISYVIRGIDNMGYQGKVADAYLQFLETFAENLVKAKWPEIKKLAEALLERKEMWADDVHELLFGGLMRQFDKDDLTSRIKLC